MFNNFYKIVSYIFILFILLIVVVSFGMPDFISQNNDSSRFFVAKVNNEVITTNELDRALSNYKRQVNDKNFPDSLMSQLRGQMIDQLIDRKIYSFIANNIGMNPLEKVQNQIFVKFLKENFSSYFSDTSNDFNGFQKRFLDPNHLSLFEIQKGVIDDFKVKTIYGLIDSTKVKSSLEQIELQQMKDIKISYKIAYLSNSSVESLVSKDVVILDNEIQVKFEKEYLSKDKKAILTDIKKESIKAELLKDKIEKAKISFYNTIKSKINTTPLLQIVSDYKMQLIEIKDVSLDKTIEASKSKDVTINLASLEEDPGFLTLLSKNNEEVISILQNKDFYLLSIVSRNIPNLSAIKTINDIEARTSSLSNEIQNISTSINDTTHEELRKLVLELEKKNITIKRFHE